MQKQLMHYIQSWLAKINFLQYQRSIDIDTSRYYVRLDGQISLIITDNTERLTIHLFSYDLIHSHLNTIREKKQQKGYNKNCPSMSEFEAFFKLSLFLKLLSSLSSNVRCSKKVESYGTVRDLLVSLVQRESEGV